MGIAKNLTVDVAIPIDGIEDPLFPLETYGRVIRIIQVYNFTNFTANLTQGSIASGSISGNATNYTVSPNNQKIFITDNMTQSVSTLNQFGGVVSQSTYIPVGFSQPYIVGATNALSLIKNNTRIYLDFQTKKVWDLQNFTTFVKNKYYKASADGPSFLDRLEGRLNLSTKYRYGLETFVDLNELASADLGVNYQYSCVDYLYWNNTLGSSIRNGGYDTDIPNVFSWLKIDQNHANIYGVNELI
jgi:phosphohistidine swiveling domain-containing protein